MNRKVVLTILLAMLTLSVCFVAVASTSNRPFFSEVQQVDNLQQLTATVPIALGASFHSNSIQPLNQPTRVEIYGFVKSNPGVHFRGICDSLGLSVGVVQYHLNVLEHAGLITACIDGQNKRYFEQGSFTKEQMELISLIRHENAAKILAILSDNGSAFHKEIAHCLGISPQALSWQMYQLKKTGLINAEKTGINVKYSLNDGDAIKAILNLTNNLRKN